MATVEQCAQALQTLADRLDAKAARERSTGFERSLSCTVRDLDVTFAGQLQDGTLHDIHRADGQDAQIKLTLTSDDLVRLVDGKLNMASAWAKGRIKVDAGMLDMLKLRSIF